MLDVKFVLNVFLITTVQLVMNANPISHVVMVRMMMMIQQPLLASHSFLLLSCPHVIIFNLNCFF
jgi:hypothetical protein